MGSETAASLGSRIASSKVALIVIAVIAMFAIVGIFDTASNWGKAYGNVSVAGMDVSGKTEEEIAALLQDQYAQRISHAQVTIFADEEAKKNGKNFLSEEERRAIAEQISNEEAVSTIGSWIVDTLSLKATVPYAEIAHQAVDLGRGEGGFLTRLGLLVTHRDIPMHVDFDANALETVASDIDRTIGEPREDSSVIIEDGKALAQEGHSGMLVDRTWLSNKISEEMLKDSNERNFIAQASNADSRIPLQTAQETADAINRAITSGITFRYQGYDWKPSATDLGNWITVTTEEENGSWTLKPSVNSQVALPAIVKGAGATITADDMTVTFENTGGDVLVHTSGSGNIPEVSQAVSSLEEALFGNDGIAWKGGEGAVIEIAESDRPETLSFDDAIAAGIITTIGEYTTEFSNQEGTENRNHNIKLAADLFNNNIITANGGTWDFNERSGPTDEAAGFWSAGSIVNGVYEDSIGGGICQVATTVFNAVYEAGLPIKERHNHSLYIASYPTGRDAAVDYPGTTLIWENNQNSDVVMKTSYTDDSITVQLYSVHTGYSVETDTGEWEEGSSYGTRYEYDENLSAGQSYRKQVGQNGQSISITRTVKDEAGKTVSEDTFSSNYKPKDEVYAIGAGTDTSSLR